MAIVHFHCFANEAIGNYMYMYYDLLETVIDEDDRRDLPQNYMEMFFICTRPLTANLIEVDVLGLRKVHWHNLCHELKDNIPDKVITKFKFSSEELVSIPSTGIPSQ